MNLAALEYLASPIDHHPLSLEGDLVDPVTGDRYPVIEDVPLLLPAGYRPNYQHQVLDIVFGASRRCLLAQVDRMADPQTYRETIEGLLRDTVGRSDVWNAFREYAELSPESCLGLPSQDSIVEDDCQAAGISACDIDAGREYATATYGEQQAERLAEMVDKWAVHLPQYVRAVLETDPRIIVELGGGAGLGTDALLRRGLGDARLISIDVDYTCDKTIEGLARWYEVADRVDPVVASFWFLPLKSGCVDVVCSHYGLDESREVPRIVQEISRVLAVGGRFVDVSRSDPTIRLRQWLGHLGFSSDELNELVSLSRLYPGLERLTGVAEQYGLKLATLEQVSYGSSHNRTVSVFVKDRG